MNIQSDVILKVKKYVRIKVIIIDKTRRKLAPLYLEKARHNILIARFLEKGVSSADVLEKLGFDSSFKAHDWVINAGYYAMYMAAQSVLAAVGVKCENHTATPYALEFYFVLKNKLEKEYVDILRKHQNLIVQDDVDSLRDGKDVRVRAQYAVTEKMEAETAQVLLNDAAVFVERMEQLVLVISK